MRRSSYWRDSASLLKFDRKIRLVVHVLCLLRRLMKLNRRNALVAATAFAVGSVRSIKQTATAEERTANFDVASAENTNVAAVADECAAACSVCLDACTEQLVSGADGIVEFMTVIRDCSDICTVTATRLARKGPMAPALQQACADACSRLVTAGRSLLGIKEVERCTAVAARCAAACRQSITAVPADSWPRRARFGL